MTASYDWLEEMLVEEGAAFAPPPPELRAGVVLRLARPEAQRAWRRVALVAAVAAALAFAATLAVEPARTGVAEFFGLIEGYEIEIVEATLDAGPARHCATDGGRSGRRQRDRNPDAGGGADRGANADRDHRGAGHGG